MAIPSIYNAQLPEPNVSFLNQDGTVSQPWRYYLLSLGVRTSTNGAGISTAVVQEEVVSLSVQTAMGDYPEMQGGVMQSLLGMASGYEPSAAPQPFLLPLLFDDAAHAAPINPFLASMLTADAT